MTDQRLDGVAFDGELNLSPSKASPVPPEDSPWGRVETKREIIPGLWSITTASHGGLYCSWEIVAELRRAFPGFRPYAGWPWLEEDCDAAIATAYWPDYFPGPSVWSVARWMRNTTNAYPGFASVEALKEWMDTDRGKHAQLVADLWEKANQATWLMQGGSGSRKGWLVTWERVGDKKRMTVRHPEYPQKCHLTPAEMQVFEAAGLAKPMT